MQNHCRSGDTWAWHIILSRMHFAAVKKGHFQPGQRKTNPETVNFWYLTSKYLIWGQNWFVCCLLVFSFLFFFETYLHKSLKIILSLSRVQKLSQNFVIWTRGNKQESFWFWRNGNIHCNQEGIHRDSWNWRCAALPMNLTSRIQQLIGTSPLAMWCVTLNPPAFHTRYWILFYLHSKISSLSLQYVVGTWVSRKPSNRGGGQLCWSLGLSSRSGCHPGGYQNPQVFHRTCCPREMQQFSELHSNLHRNH